VRHDCVGQRKKGTDGSSLEVTAHIHAPDNANNDAECLKAAIQQRAVNTVERPVNSKTAPTNHSANHNWDKFRSKSVLTSI